MCHQNTLDHLAISHGQVLTVISGMNIVPWLSRSALDSILKKFRLEHVPNFKKTGQEGRAGADFIYGYTELMDCVIAMKLAGEGIAFRHVVALLTFDQDKLSEFYRRAYLEADRGLGEAITIESSLGRSQNISGLYLDFAAQISGSGILSTPGPKLLDPWQALERYMGSYDNSHPVGMLRLSQLAVNAVKIALDAPPLRRGKKPRSSAL